LVNPLDFSAVEAALVAQLIVDVDEFTTGNMKAHDYDSAYKYAMSHDDTSFFAWTDFAGGQNQGRGIWAHRIALTVGIFYSEGLNPLDEDVRTIISAVQASLLPDTTLSGAATSARIDGVGSVVPWENIENSLSHVTLTFNIIAEEQMRTGSAR